MLFNVTMTNVTTENTLSGT